MTQVFRWISGDSRRRFAVSLMIAVAACLLMRGRVSLATQSIGTWDIFAVSSLALAWLTIVMTPQNRLRGHAKEQDVGRIVISVSVATAACVALFAVAFLIRGHTAEIRVGLNRHVLLALSTVALSWVLLHTVFSFHYAHLFYGDVDEDDGRAGGLEFPNERMPDYLDFAYFSFVIGMTCQVSDVQITSRTLRRLALLHGILSFVYNTVILALLINTVSGLL